jgi:two-component sensor histidine kinase/CheY-like chemotaxis protein
MKTKKYMLIIDDEAAMRKSMTIYFEDLGFEVETALNGKRGLESIHKKIPDILLVDLRMPEMDGFEVIEFVKTEYPLLPVVAVSGTGKVKDVIEAIRKGAWEFVTKPIVNLDILHHIVKRCLEKGALIKENEAYKNELEERVKERTAELNKANEELQKLLKDKLILIRDIHHRVKNNLMVIQSLAEFERQKYADKAPVSLEDFNAAFESLSSRINAISAIYSELYQQKEHLDFIPSAPYVRLLGDLVQDLFSDMVSSVTIKHDLDHIQLTLDALIPMGLILNELLTNSYKYAFGAERTGEIEIKLKVKDNQVLLEYRDSGPGFDFQLSDTNKSFGLTLVQLMTEQLGGKVTYHPSPTSHFCFEFDIDYKLSESG